MANIALLIASEPLASDELTFDENATEQMLFECVENSDPLVNKTTDSGINLNGRKYEHILYSHNEQDIVISADEISTDDGSYDFICDFWVSNLIYIANCVNGTWSDYARIQTPSGKIPISYLEGVKLFKEFSFTAFYLEPN